MYTSRFCDILILSLRVFVFVVKDLLEIIVKLHSILRRQSYPFCQRAIVHQIHVWTTVHVLKSITFKDIVVAQLSIVDSIVKFLCELLAVIRILGKYVVTFDIQVFLFTNRWLVKMAVLVLCWTIIKVNRLKLYFLIEIMIIFHTFSSMSVYARFPWSNM